MWIYICSNIAVLTYNPVLFTNYCERAPFQTSSSPLTMSPASIVEQRLVPPHARQTPRATTSLHAMPSRVCLIFRTGASSLRHSWMLLVGLTLNICSYSAHCELSRNLLSLSPKLPFYLLAHFRPPIACAKLSFRPKTIFLYVCQSSHSFN